ncbi:MAG: gliding motility-associated ABC transporter substrate-binding protein GldG [Flavobacteriales bacterium]|jgi:gliding-associated putative ABC transporter substrate-binding component GldG|nr:gliding motility-associated ABC transporter substrate-binding protein GldG [Flavobacteriales bacterium]
MTKRKSPITRHLIEIIAVLAIIILVNFISKNKYARLDLTEDKIHTLSDRTVTFFEEELDGVVNIEIYLDGEFPAHVQKLQNAVKEKLEEFKAYSKHKIKYKFINPNKDKALADDLKRTIYEDGIYPMYLVDRSEGSEEKIEFWPGAIIRYKDQQTAVNFLQIGNYLVSAPQVNAGINQLEYSFIKSFWDLTKKKRHTISFLRGHGELDNADARMIRDQLLEFYNVDTVQIRKYLPKDSVIKEDIHALDQSDALIIAKPQQPFNEKEKYLIDQFIMQGKKVFWLIDMVQVPEDSLAIDKFIYSSPIDLNIDDMLFKYGVRVNKDLITDANCGATWRRDNYKPLYNWFLYPRVGSNHITMQNVAPVILKYVNSIEAVGTPNINKTVILETSKDYKKMPSRFRVSYDFLDGYNPTLSQQVKDVAQLPLGYILEGEFDSHYKGRITNTFIENKSSKFKDKSKPNKMVVIGDGDVIRNELGQTQKGNLVPYRLEFDPMVRDNAGNLVPYHGNGIFFLNLVDYMMGNDYLIPLRSRMKTQRLLNRKAISLERTKWQVINLVIPIFIVVILGLIQLMIRKRKYTA